MAVTISRIPFVKLPEVFSSLMTSPALLGKGLALGLVSTFFPFVSYTLGLRQMEAGKASIWRLLSRWWQLWLGLWYLEKCCGLKMCWAFF